MPKITIERETLERAADALLDLPLRADREVIAAALRAALAAQPAEPVAWLFHTPDGTLCVASRDLRPSYDCTPVYTAPPAPAAVPPGHVVVPVEHAMSDMDAVATQYAHKMALDLECILAEYGGSWYNAAMQTLAEYRSAMNEIHERESPTFMGEPLIAASQEKT